MIIDEGLIRNRIMIAVRDVVGANIVLLEEEPNRLNELVRADTDKVDGVTVELGDQAGQELLNIVKMGGSEQAGGHMEFRWTHTLRFYMDTETYSAKQVTDRVVAVAKELVRLPRLYGIAWQLWRPPTMEDFTDDRLDNFDIWFANLVVGWSQVHDVPPGG
jgi:hypothetical protein